MRLAIPQIELVYSKEYDQECYRSWKSGMDGLVRSLFSRYPCEEEVRRRLIQVKEEWNKYSNQILTKLAQVSGLQWSEPIITCYLVGWSSSPYSDPVTLPSYESIEDSVYTITHEIIHRLFVQNSELIDSTRQYFREGSYSKELPRGTRTHIRLYALQAKVVSEIAGLSLEHLAKTVPKKKAYQKAWSFIKEEGHEKVLQEFINSLKMVRR
jgi:hypothetical protein